MHHRAAFVALAVLLLPSGALADYADTGPEAYVVSPLSPTGGATGGSLVVPKGAGPFPLLVLSHGFSASADNQVGWGTHFASYGFVVAVPSFPSTFSPNHSVNAGIVQQLVALYTNPGTSSPAQGKVDGARVGLEGHSAGGLATTLAAAQLSPQAVVLFDPVDANDLAKPVYATLCSPVLDLFAGPSSCNNQAGWKPFAATAKGPVLFADVVASNHCDGENAPRSLCGPFCGGGGADAGRQKVYARWATAMFLGYLKNDVAAQAMLAQGPMAADPGLAAVTVQTAPSCAVTTSDAGLDGSVGPADAAAPKDSGPPSLTDSGTTDHDAGVPQGATSGNEAGCACHAAPGESPSGGPSAFGFAVLALWGLRRRRTR